jgi:hypothetical protein
VSKGGCQGKNPAGLAGPVVNFLIFRSERVLQHTRLFDYGFFQGVGDLFGRVVPACKLAVFTGHFEEWFVGLGLLEEEF